MSVDASGDRRAELAAGLAAVRARIEAACAACGRDPGELTLVVVTKTYPASDVALLTDLGVHDVGENRDQEAAAKVAALAGTPGAGRLTWHFIGQVQTNKARHVARYADLVHSVDRPALVDALAKGARAAGRRVGCLVQVSLDGDPSRGGTPVEDVPALAGAIAGYPDLELRGVMAVAPLGADPLQAFAVLPRLRDRLRSDHPRAEVISAGMSADLEAAVTVGATHLRVGSAVLGSRSRHG